MPWDLTGNAGTNPVTNPGGTDFLGTTDNQPLVIETNAAGIGNRPSVFIAASNAPNMNRGWVGIGTEAPQTQLHVETHDMPVDQYVPTVHTAGPGAAYSFAADHLRGFPSFQTPLSGERWMWYARRERPSPVPAARLWSRADKLIVNSYGQVLLPGDPLVPFYVHYPNVDLGELPPWPDSPRVHGELFLGAHRTSIRGFDGPLQSPPAAPGGMHLGNHWIRTNGNQNELWMGFQRAQFTFPPFTAFAYRMLAAVEWTGPAFTVGSDARLKTNVQQVEGALEKLERIRGVAFEWAEAESPYALGGVPGQPSLGVVAQEVEEVFPEVVSTYDVPYAEPDQYETDQEDKEEYMAVDYNGLTSVLIEAVKELKAQNEELRSRVDALEQA
jgi:hypothetical protein